MRQTNNTGRRPRGRPNRKPQGTNRNQNFDSSGPDGRIRGGANQIYEKYLTLARDAGSAGDRIAAEAFYQHAEHYFRIMNESTDPESPNGLGQRSNQGERDVNGRGQGDDRQRRHHDSDAAAEAATRQPNQPVRSPSGAPVAPPAAVASSPAAAPVTPQAVGDIPGMEPQPAIVAESQPVPSVPPNAPPQEAPALAETPGPQAADKPRRGRPPRKRPAPSASPAPKASDATDGDGSVKKAGTVEASEAKAQAEAPAEKTPAPVESDGLAS